MNRKNLSTNRSKPSGCCKADERIDSQDPADVSELADGFQIAQISIAGMSCGA